MADFLPMPRYGDTLPSVEVRTKGEWTGSATRALGLLVSLGELLRLKVARRFVHDFNTVFPWQPGIVWTPPGSVLDPGEELHERLHAWHYERLGFWRYVWRYIWHRDHCEAAAYALEVAAGYRTLGSAAKVLADPIYGIGNATVLLMEYIVVIEAHGWTWQRLREEVEQ